MGHAPDDTNSATVLWETETCNGSCWYVCGSIMRYNECSLVSTSYRRHIDFNDDHYQHVFVHPPGSHGLLRLAVSLGTVPIATPQPHPNAKSYRRPLNGSLWHASCTMWLTLCFRYTRRARVDLRSACGDLRSAKYPFKPAQQLLMGMLSSRRSHAQAKSSMIPEK